ncbi:XRE family transcriptional regulator [Streptosporangium sp. KLBMP 9127]|nr:XRE family transcriptional regulator [Streptosporangium sp. KLBMP 9127]
MISIPASPDLGPRVREIRKRRRFSLTEGAQRAGLTKGFLSRFERGQVSISVASLLRLCAALDLDVAELFGDPGGSLVRAESRPRVQFGGNGMTEFQLTPKDEQRLQVLLSVIEPGGGSGQEPYTLPVDIEFVHVLGGELAVDAGGEEITLAEGDAFLFPGNCPHTFINRGGVAAKVLWVLSPALTSRR